MKYETWLNPARYGKIGRAAFHAMQVMDPDYIGNLYDLYEEFGYEDSPYQDAFILAQLKNLCPNQLVYQRIFTLQGVSRDELYEFERVTRARTAQEIPKPETPKKPPKPFHPRHRFDDFDDSGDEEEDLPF